MQAIDVSTYINVPAQEAFRVLSTNLVSNGRNQDLTVISMISFNPGEGKTTVAINLAIAVAKSGAKTLFIDADIRKPWGNKRRDEPFVGLTNFLQGDNVDQFIFDTGVKRLSYAGPGTNPVDPVEFLGGSNFAAFLEAVSDKYDMVIIDTPSCGNYVDAALIASKSSGALIIARVNETSYKNIERIKWQMDNVGANLIGIIMNRVPRTEYKSYHNLDIDAPGSE